MLEGVKAAVGDAARKGALISGGALCLLVGAAFLTVAAWVAMVPAYGIATTATIIGMFYAGCGFLLVAIALLGNRKPVTKTQAQPAPHPPLMQAFLVGLQAGVRSEKRRN